MALMHRDTTEVLRLNYFATLYSECAASKAETITLLAKSTHQLRADEKGASVGNKNI